MKKIKVGEDRQLVFDRTLRKNLFNFDISDYETVDFNGFNLYKNFNFSIFTDSYCNADCPFCCAKLRYEQECKRFCRNKDYTEQYFKRLEYILNTIKPFNPSISITGGEPTLSPKIFRIIDLVDKIGFRKKVITTNGAGLFRKDDNGVHLIQRLINAKFDHLNISRAHYDDAKNNEMMKFNNEDHQSTDNDVKDAVNVIKANNSNMKIRMSCILAKGFIDNIDKIKTYIDHYQNIGIEDFVFRDLMIYDERSINKSIKDFYDKSRIDLYDMYEIFDTHPEFRPFLNILGYYYYTELFKYQNSTVATEKADLQREYEVFKSDTKNIYEMIFHPNGNLCSTWNDDEGVINI